MTIRSMKNDFAIGNGHSENTKHAFCVFGRHYFNFKCGTSSAKFVKTA